MEEKKPSLQRFEEVVRENQDLKRELADCKARLEAALKKEEDDDDLF